MRADVQRSDAERRPGGGRVTIVDVAAEAGVSRQTVSNVINYPDRVQAATLTRVAEVIDRLGYQPTSAAQSLRHQRAGAVGVEVNALGGGEPSEIAYPFLVRLSLAAPAHGCHMVTFGSTEDHVSLEPYRQTAGRRLVDAFVIADTHPADPRPRWLGEQGIPFASFGRVWDDPTFTGWADVDGHAGCREAVEHLLESGYGAAAAPDAVIAFLGWPPGSVVGDDRRAGWRAGLSDAGQAAGPDVACEQDLGAATDAALELLPLLPAGSAVVCVSDVLAIGVLQAARDLGVRIGRDLGVVGFDGSISADRHGLTTLAQPLDAIADHLLGVVQHQLATGERPDAGRLFRPTLLGRHSTVRGETPKENPS